MQGGAAPPLHRAVEERELLKTGRLSSKEARFYLLPDLVIIDGGKGQLSAARHVMRELGFDRIGLRPGQEEEHLFAEGRPDPLSCPRAPGRSTCCSACATGPPLAWPITASSGARPG